MVEGRLVKTPPPAAFEKQSIEYAICPAVGGGDGSKFSFRFLTARCLKPIIFGVAPRRGVALLSLSPARKKSATDCSLKLRSMSEV